MNLPNEAEAWAADFSYGYLERLYGRIKRDFDLHLIGDGSGLITATRPCALIRHDVDVNLERALSLAEWEASWNVGATYHVMIDSPLYDVSSERSVAVIGAIAEMGHEVGLHYDAVARKTEEADAAAREKDIDEACRVLEGVAGCPVRSVSFHRPTPGVMRGPLRIAGRVSANAEALCRWYLSDSRGRWREGNPIDAMDTPRDGILQILIHPIWWGESNEPPDMRLRSFLLGQHPDASPQRYEELRAALYDHILYRAADL